MKNLKSKKNSRSLTTTQLEVALKTRPKLRELFDLCENGVYTLFKDELVADIPFQRAMPIIHHNIMAIATYFMRTLGEKHNIACKAGCSFCCYVRVKVTPLELFIMARHLRAKLSEIELQKFKERLLENERRIRGLTSFQHAALKMPCIFLDKGGDCSVYEKRPLGCRRWTSTARSACETAFLSKDGRGDIPHDGEIYVAGAGVEEGLVTQLEEMGLDANHYELHSGLLRIFQTDDAEGKWLRREPVFDDCIQ